MLQRRQRERVTKLTDSSKPIPTCFTSLGYYPTKGTKHMSFPHRLFRQAAQQLATTGRAPQTPSRKATIFRTFGVPADRCRKTARTSALVGGNEAGRSTSLVVHWTRETERNRVLHEKRREDLWISVLTWFGSSALNVSGNVGALASSGHVQHTAVGSTSPCTV